MLHSAIAVCEQSLVELRKCHSEADAFLLCFRPRIVVHTCLPGEFVVGASLRIQYLSADYLAEDIIDNEPELFQ